MSNFPDDFRSQASGSPFAPVISRDAATFLNLGDEIEALASRLLALSETVRERADESRPDMTIACDIKSRLTLLSDAVARLEHAA